MPSLIYLLVGSSLAGLILVWAGRRWRKLAAGEMRVVLSGGGTGGHVNPALAIAEGIRNREPDARFLYLGVRGKAESVIVKRVGYPLIFVTSEGFPGLRPSIATLRFLIKLAIGVTHSAFVLMRFAPRWVIATGGYVSAPVILAGILLKACRIAPCKVFLHEQNSIPGQLNGLLGRWVDRVLLTFPQTLTFFPRNGVVVGYPIRHSIAPSPREEALSRLSFGIPEGRRVVFAFGGSQGARTINRAVVDALRHLLPYRERLFIVHGMGLAHTGKYDSTADTEARIEKVFSPEERQLLDGFYYRQDYFHNIADVYSVSDVIVCRSGAGSLNEISSLGRAAILIPKANLPGDHQVMNARAMKHAGAAEVLFEDTVVEEGQVLEKLSGKLLADRILKLLNDPVRQSEMSARSTQFLRRHANERILSELYEDNSFNNGVGYRTVPFRPLLNNRRLLEVLQTAYNRDSGHYDPAKAVGDEDDLIYYRHRAAGLLSHETWQDRNLGVKLIGLTRYDQKIPTLLYMLADRTPVPRFKRFFGGDFKEVGFIRRNIVSALKVLNIYNAEIDRHLLIAADDPYFEVRSQVFRTVAHFGPYLSGSMPWIRMTFRGLKDSCFEVVVEAAKALGEIGSDDEAVKTLLKMNERRYWQVRDAALRGIHRLLERRVVDVTPALLSELSSFILTATDFRPHFSIKESYKQVQQCCQERLLAESPPASSSVLPDAAARKR